MICFLQIYNASKVIILKYSHNISALQYRYIEAQVLRHKICTQISHFRPVIQWHTCVQAHHVIAHEIVNKYQQKVVIT